MLAEAGQSEATVNCHTWGTFPPTGITSTFLPALSSPEPWGCGGAPLTPNTIVTAGPESQPAPCEHRQGLPKSTWGPGAFFLSCAVSHFLARVFSACETHHWVLSLSDHVVSPSHHCRKPEPSSRREWCCYTFCCCPSACKTVSWDANDKSFHLTLPIENLIVSLTQNEI